MAKIFWAIMLLFSTSQAADGRQSTSLPANTKVDFTRDVDPILRAQCHACHGSSQPKAGLRLDTRAAALRGGDSGAVILPGNSAQSKLILRLVGSELGIQMPPTGPLTAEEIAVLRAWIDQGADWPEVSLTEAAPSRNSDSRSENLFRAIRKGNADTVRALLRSDRSLVNVRDASGATPLMHGCLYAGEDLVKLLLDQGADPNLKNNAGVTALMWGVGDARKVRLLVARGADVNARSQDGKTPLLIAAGQSGATGIVKLLLEKGADIKAGDANGSTALIQAAGGGDAETLRFLITRGSDVNAASNGGGTALMAAVRTRNAGSVQLLLEHGAEVNSRTKRGITALSLAANLGSTDIVRVLLEKGAEVNVEDDRGYTALMLAAYSDFLAADLVKLLLDHGARVAAISQDGETALSLAETKGDTAVVRLLKAAAGDPGKTGGR
jgi:serine/threonine-protein phosphatase 6 regulatory ankyrin repeat subunit B